MNFIENKINRVDKINIEMESLEIQSIQNILSQVSEINERYKKRAEHTGENFNIFRLLKIEADEVRTHSAFLAELLDPKGSHGHGDKFLKLFIQYFNIEDCDNMQLYHAEVMKEEYFEKITKGKTQRGRIDIIVKIINGQVLIIENKIYAEDGFEQLLKYRTFYPKAHLFYLTLDGECPNKESTGKKKIDFTTISYKKDILMWLESCREEIVSHSILKETITQYINLIKYLTNQTMNNEMKEKLIDIISSSDLNIEATFEIKKVISDIKIKLINQLTEQLANAAKEKKWKFKVDESLGKIETGFRFHPAEWKRYFIEFYFDSSEFNGFYFCIRKKPKDPDMPEIREILSGKKYLPWTISYEYFHLKNWDKDAVPWKNIISGKMKNDIVEKTEWIIKKLRVLEQKL